MAHYLETLQLATHRSIAPRLINFFFFASPCASLTRSGFLPTEALGHAHMRCGRVHCCANGWMGLVGSIMRLITYEYMRPGRTKGVIAEACYRLSGCGFHTRLNRGLGQHSEGWGNTAFLVFERMLTTIVERNESMISPRRQQNFFTLTYASVWCVMSTKSWD